MKASFFFLPVLASFSLLSTTQALEVSQNPTDATPSTTVRETHKDYTVKTATATEIVKMKDAGLDASVIRAYVQTLRVPYKATTEDILYLHERNVGDDVICDWIKKGADLVSLAAHVPASSPDLVGNAGAQAPQMIQAQPQQPPVIYQTAPEATPSVAYASPTYAYYDGYASPYYYAPGISIGLGFGWPYYYGGCYYGHGGYYHGGYYHGGGYNHGGYYHGGVHTASYVGHSGGSVAHVGGGGHMGGGFGGGGHGGGGHR